MTAEPTESTMDESVTPILVNADELRATTAAIFVAHGLTEADAAQAADVLVTADLRGVDTHGVSNMFRSYLTWLGNGHADARPDVRITRDRAAVANLDGGMGLGVVVAPRAMRMAMDRARATGIGMVTVHNTRHLGMAAYHSMLALEAGMIGITATSAGPGVLPTFGREPRLGTNPIAIAAPAATLPAFVFDAATSTITINRVSTSRRLRAPLPPGTVAAPDGSPLLEPMVPPVTPAPEGLWLLPLGGTREAGSHKGYGLGASVEVLTTILSTCQSMMELGRGQAAHMLLAVDVSAFVDPAEFRAGMDRFIAALNATPPAPGHERVLVAGQPEWECARRRTHEGIPLHPEVVAWFDETCAARGVPELPRR